MKKKCMLMLAGLAVVGLAGCAGSPDSQELSQATVEYGCGPGGEQPLTVQYTFRGDQAVSARVVHMNQVVDMMRVTSGNADMVGNTFKGGGYTWVTEKFDRDDVDEVAGNMLTMDAPAGSSYGAAPAYGQQAPGYPGSVQPQGGTYGAPAGAYGAPPNMPPPGGMQGAVPAGQPGTVATVLVRDCRPT
jgi:hypothetical protein